MMTTSVNQRKLKTLSTLRTQLSKSKVERLLSQYYEKKLEIEVSKIFQQMKLEVLAALREYYNPSVMFNAQVDLIVEPIHRLHRKYYETLMKYNIREFDKSRNAGKRIVEHMVRFRRKGRILKPLDTAIKADLTEALSSEISKDKLFGTNPVTHDNLAERTYKLSEKTLARVDSDINKIVTKGYDDGWGINKVGRDIEDRFDQLRDWEARRIARTEIHNSNVLGIIKGYDDIGVEYLEWITSIDGRERDSHRELDGEIIPVGATFSNGLMYPGDLNGSAAEVINCRCTVAPFIIPDGYIAPPDMLRFRESDLVPTLDYYNADDIVAQAMQEIDIPQIKGIDKYALNEVQKARLAELEALNEVKPLKFLDRRELKELKKQVRYNELHNKLLREGKLSDELLSEYNSLQYDLEDILVQASVETKSTSNLFDDVNYFKLSETEAARRKELMQKSRDKTITIEEKHERRLLGERERIQDLHEKLLTEGLDESETRLYLEGYARLKKQGMNLPDVPLDLKFTTPAQSWEVDNWNNIKIGKKFSLNKTEQNELYTLEKRKLLSEKKLIDREITESELSRITELQNQRRFNQLYYLKTNEGGLSYSSEVEYRKLFSQFKTKLNLEKSLLKTDLPKYKKPQIKPSTDKPLRLKGTTEDGSLPGNRNITDLFTVDVKNCTLREQAVAERWLGNDYSLFRDYTVRCDGDLKKYTDWVLNEALDKDRYMIVRAAIDNNDKDFAVKAIREIAESVEHDLPVLDNLLENNCIKVNMKLFRVEERLHLGDNPKIGDVVTFKGRNSTAVTKEGAEHFGEVSHREFEWLYEIDAPAGTKGAYVAHLNQAEKFAREMEFLLANDTKMQIKSIDWNNHYVKLKIV